MTVLMRLGSLVIGYAFGLIQTSYLLGKAKGVDIRTLGSGNAGTTNALRNFGKGAGALVLLVDCLKAVLAMVLARAIFGGSFPTSTLLPALYAGFGAMLGHCFPFYMGFRGGKGIACLAGIFLVTSGKLTLFAFLVFALVFFVTNYVSLGSILAAVIFPLGVLALSLSGKMPQLSTHRMEGFIVALAICVLALVQHRENIKRLRRGEERKTYLSKKNRG